MWNFFKRWSEINENTQVNVRNFSYFNQLKQILIGNIDLKTDNDRLSFNMLNYAIDGCCIIDKDKKVYFGRLADIANNDGSWDGLSVTGNSYYNADTFTGTVGVDCEVFFFNPWHLPEMLLPQLADQFNNIDVWESYAINNSKNNPFIVVDNETDKKSMEEALKESDNGKPHVFVGRSLLNKIFKNNKTSDVNPYLTLNVNDINAMTIVQYSCEYRDNLMKRFATLYGHANFTTSKHAQVNTDEIAGNRTISFLYIDGLMKEMKECIEKINKLLGTEWTVNWCELEEGLLEDELNDMVKDDVEEPEGGEGSDDNGGDEDEGND